MNILCCNPNGGAFHHITRSWGRTFKALGYRFRKWDGKRESWDKFKPNLYLGCSGHRQPIPSDLRRKYKTKIGIHVNPYGKRPLKKVHGQDINEPQGTVKWTVQQKPDFVFGYGIQEDEKDIWSYYREKHRIPWYGVPTAGDPVHYYPDPDKNLVCDVGFVGGRWGYKAHNLDPYLVPLLKKYDYKCFGWGGWDKICKSSALPDETDIDRKLFSSAKLCPSICEPHTTIYSIDWPERIFKIPLCGGFTISDRVSGFDRYLPTDVFPMANNPKEFIKLCDYYLKNGDERRELAKKQRAYIAEHHTYYNRIKTLMRACKFDAEVLKIEQEIDRFKSKHLDPA